MNIKYLDLSSKQQILTNHYTNIWIASIWLTTSTPFYLVSDLVVSDYTLTISSANLTGFAPGSLYLIQVVTEKSPIAYYPGNS